MRDGKRPGKDGVKIGEIVLHSWDSRRGWRAYRSVSHGDCPSGEDRLGVLAGSSVGFHRNPFLTCPSSRLGASYT